MQGFGHDQSYPEIVLKGEEPQGHVAMQTICSLLTPEELFISSFIFPACGKTEFMKSQVLTETRTVGTVQEGRLDPASPMGYGCPLLQILQVSKSE